MREQGFLQTIRDNPKDDATLLVYADWLEEQGDAVSTAKAEFLRETVRVASRPAKRGWREERRKRLQELAATLDTAWLAVVSRLKIEMCDSKRAETESRRFGLEIFNYVCEGRWEDLKATEDEAVRFCDTCQHQVYYCETIMEAREHAEEMHCIAVDLGVIRREDDLVPRRIWKGEPSAETIRQEMARREPDAVSAERERRKREGEDNG